MILKSSLFQNFKLKQTQSVIPTKVHNKPFHRKVNTATPPTANNFIISHLQFPFPDSFQLQLKTIPQYFSLKCKTNCHHDHVSFNQTILKLPNKTFSTAAVNRCIKKQFIQLQSQFTSPNTFQPRFPTVVFSVNVYI